MFRRVLLILGTVAAWFLPGHFAVLALLAMIWGTAMSTTNTAKARNTEQRVSGLVTAVVGLKSQQGTFAGFSGANQSQAMPGGMIITYNPQNSANEGGNNSQTSGQIGGAAAHVHSMTHYHTESVDLQTNVNKLQSSFSDICGRLNTMYAALQRANIL
jgi:hypothetical protein